MTGVGKTRDVGARTLTIWTIVAAVFAIGGAQPVEAQASAPIVYAKAAPAPSASSRRVEFAAPNSERAINLLPGATKVSFGPAVPTTRMAPASPLASTPAYAEPYAGPPYEVDGKWYVPTHEPNYDEVGIASWYGPTFHGKASASGETFDENAMTAAHPTLPIPSLVRVTNLENGRSVVVRLNDRGPFVDDRIIDLSRAAGKALDMHAKGTVRVRVQYVGPAPAEANSAPVQRVEIQQVSAVPIVRPTPDFQVVTEPLPDLVPASTPVPAWTPAARAAEQHGYFLQAGSFVDLGNAHAAMAKLKAVGPVSVVEADINGVTYYRVMVGPWVTRGRAEQTQDRLTESGMKSFVVARLGK